MVVHNTKFKKIKFVYDTKINYKTMIILWNQCGLIQENSILSLIAYLLDLPSKKLKIYKSFILILIILSPYNI